MAHQCPVRFLAALPSVSDLLLCAKHLFIAAMVDGSALRADGLIADEADRSDATKAAITVGQEQHARYRRIFAHDSSHLIFISMSSRYPRGAHSPGSVITSTISSPPGTTSQAGTRILTSISRARRRSRTCCMECSTQKGRTPAPAPAPYSHPSGLR